MTGLLVSVRDSSEAQAALKGGVDLIDIKEPRAGALGAASVGTWRKIADVVVVDGDPFAFDTLGDRISQVWKDGVKVV